jgi:hypothetical protein
MLTQITTACILLSDRPGGLPENGPYKSSFLRRLIFCDRDWKEIGTKSSLSRLIAEITRISESDMVNFEPVNGAVKMSWASGRQTTRTEDIAYCLMGLFGIRMPML